MLCRSAEAGCLVPRTFPREFRPLRPRASGMLGCMTKKKGDLFWRGHCVTDTDRSHANIEAAVRAILSAGALPAVLGGDQAINIPCFRAFSAGRASHIVQIDAYLDFVDERHGNPMRRAAEPGPCDRAEPARHSQCQLHRTEAKPSARTSSRWQVRKLWTEAVLARTPHRYRRSDPSVAAGTGTPSHGGFLDVLAARQPIVGIDMVEVAPDYDATAQPAGPDRPGAPSPKALPWSLS